MTTEFTDLGHGHAYAWTSWSPDRNLNPQYKDIQDVERYGILLKHSNPDGNPCMGGVIFEGPVADEIHPDAPKWEVESWMPLTLRPSILCSCGDHGYLRDGKWLPA